MQVIVEVDGHYGNNGGVINELEFYNGDTKLTYTTTGTDAYDVNSTDSLKRPLYWIKSPTSGSILWDRTNLNDGNNSYGDQASTLFGSAVPNEWARFLVNIDGDNIDIIKFWLGGTDTTNNNRTIKCIRVYKVTEAYNKTQHLDNRNNDGLVLIGSLKISKELASSTMFEINIPGSILIKSNNKYYTYNGEWVEVELTEPLIAQYFIDYGFNSIISKEKIDELSDELEIYTYSLSEDIPQMNMLTHYKPIMLLDDPEILLLTDIENPTLRIEGYRNLIPYTTSDKIKILQRIPSNDTNTYKGEVVGKLKEPFYRYKVDVDDTSTVPTQDLVLQNWSDWTSQEVNQTLIVPAGFVNKMNPYNIYVSAEEYNHEGYSDFTTVLLYNTKPYILGTVKNNKINLTMGDEESDKLQFKIILNNVQIYPNVGYTTLEQSPIDFTYTIDSNYIDFGKNNVLQIVVRDEFKVENTLSLNFMGDYAGLMFIDEDGHYFSTDKGVILQRLDFGIIYAGKISDIMFVNLKNQNSYKVKNIKINVDPKTIPDKSEIMLSKTLDPFVPENTLIYNDTLDIDDSVPFYVRVKTNVFAQSGGVFKILVDADPVS